MGDSHDGIILLRDYGFTPEEYEALQPGDDAMHLLHLDEPILEINVTPDRGYAFSYRGIRTRVPQLHRGWSSRSGGRPLKMRAPQLEDQNGQTHDIDVIIDDDNPIHGVVGCDRFYVRAVHDYKPGSPTPNWMRHRLSRAGMRSLSLPVDVTNYVMLDLGQPCMRTTSTRSAGRSSCVAPRLVRRWSHWWQEA